MAAMREKWLNSQYKVMIDFVYDFLKGRFDKHLRDYDEREKAKTQPSGYKFWEYLTRLEGSYEDWDLGECGHSSGSCRSKWSKYLQTRLHQVERVETEKFLFIYFKFGIKLSREEADHISQQYCAYDMTWRDGVLKYYLKKVNLRVETRRAEKESEDRKRKKRERNQASALIREDPQSMEEDEDMNAEVVDHPPVKRTRREVIMERIVEIDSSQEIKEEPLDEDATSETSDSRRNRRNRRREVPPASGGSENASTVTRAEAAAPAEAEPDAPPPAPPSPPSNRPSRNERTTMVAPETIQAIWDEMTEDSTREGKREGLKERRKKERPSGTTSLRRLIDGEMGDTVAAIYEQVPTLHSGSPGEFEAAESTHSDNATAASEVTPNGAEEQERMGKSHLARKNPLHSRRLLGGRPTPAELVARVDRPVQRKRAAAAAADFAGFKRRSNAGQKALLRVAVDANQEDEESEVPKVQRVEPMESEEGIRWEILRERLLERMKSRRGENEKKSKVKKTMTLLNSSSRLAALCETRAAAAALITEDEELSMSVFRNLLDDEDWANKSVALANEVYNMNIEEDPAVKEGMMIKLCGDMAVDRLKETMTNALEDDSLWE